MDDVDCNIKRVCGYAEMSDPRLFDKFLPEEPFPLPTKSNRIIYKTKAGTTQTIILKNKNKHLHIIFTACLYGFQSDWFSTISDRSKPSYFDVVRNYFDWANESDNKNIDNKRYETLKLFESYCLNERGLKRSTLGFINKVIREGMGSSKLSDNHYNYLQTLLPLSKPAKFPDSNPVTLSNWFSLPWLRSIIGEKAYLQIDSPRLLFNSFRVTVATTLLYLLEQRQHWLKGSFINFDTSTSNWEKDWNRIILERKGSFNKEGEPKDELSHLLWLDLVRPSGSDILKERAKKIGIHNLPRQLYDQKEKKTIAHWQKPAFFHPDNQTRYSQIEEVLCAWLVACESVQPTDIPKLKTTNYTIERNRSGRLIAMEGKYYKGRSGQIKQPAILMGSDPWTQAMDRYMAGLCGPDLFSRNIAHPLNFTGLINNNFISFLLKVWDMPSFQQKLKSDLYRTGATSLFLDAMLALRNGYESPMQYRKRTGKTIAEYRKSSTRALPGLMFSLTHIKNTAVHAGTDAYRSADLINHHSHCSLTEKTSYLTDQNKEWVNQAGRITRLVLHDLQNVVYQPSITAISQSVYDLELRTKISEATHITDIVTQKISGSHILSESESIIVVSDTIDAALYFTHYITQAEALLPKLIAVRPDWVERTLIVQVEWMTRTLTRMKAAATAQKTYKKLSIHLPPLFDHLLETSE